MEDHQNQNITVITLSTLNIPRARKFYERLGWKPGHHDNEVAFFQLNGSVLSLYERKAYARDIKHPLSKVKPGGVDVGVELGVEGQGERSHGAGQEGRCEVRGRRRTRFGAVTRATLADLDGHPWEVAWNPFWKLDAKGGIRMK